MWHFSLIWDLARKDWRLFLADRQAALLCFLVPIVLASVFGALFHRPGSNGAVPRLPVLLVCEDDTPFSQRLVERLLKNEQLEARPCERAAALRDLVDRSSGVVLVLPAGFGRHPQLGQAEGRRPEVEVYCPAGQEFQGRWAEGVLTEAYLKEATQEWLGKLGMREDKLLRPFEVRLRPPPGVTGLSGHAYSHSFCGMTLQYLLFWGLDSGLMLLRERQRGLWRRVRTAPVPLWILLLGKVLSISVIALAQIALTFAFGFVVFGVRITGSLVGFGLLAVASALLSAATGLLVAALGGSEARARSLSIVVILLLAFVGGLWLPSFLLPDWVQSVGPLLPTAWAVRGLGGVTWQGMGLAGASGCAIALAGFSLAFLAVAYWRFRGVETRLLCKGGE